MAYKTTLRTAAIAGGVAVAGYFLWKYAEQRGAQTGSPDDISPVTTLSTAPKGHIMTHILHIDSSARAESSHSRTISGELVAAMKAADPSVTVTYRDLGHQAIPHVSEAFIGAMYTPAESRTEGQKAEVALSDELVAELLAADTYVFGIPMYNFTVPSVFKAYIDQIVRPGVTFDPAAYKGLLLNKKIIVVEARGGGGYGAGEARESSNLQDPVIKAAFGLLGVTDIDFIPVNNTIRGDDVTNGALAEARAKIKAITQAK